MYVPTVPTTVPTTVPNIRAHIIPAAVQYVLRTDIRANWTDDVYLYIGKR